MKYAWIENEKIRDVCEGGNPADCYTANVAANYNTLVPDEAKNGDGWVNNQLVPFIPRVPQPLPQMWEVDTVRSKLTLADKTKWDNDATTEIITAKIEFSTPQNLTNTTELLDYLVASQSISEQSKTNVLSVAATAVAYSDVSGNQPNVIG
jgi:hypothetical protein